MILAIVLKQLFPQAVFGVDLILEDDGSGPRIVVWNLPQPQPDQAALAAAWATWQAGALDRAKAAALATLNEWRGSQRKTLGLTDAWGQDLVYSGKMMMALRWLEDQESAFYFAQEATARGLSNLEMAELITEQGEGWLSGSDAIEAEYIMAKTAIEAGESQAEIDAVLEGLS